MKSTMKALVCHQNGSIQLMDRPLPAIQNTRDAVVRVTLSSICTSDLHIMHGAVPRAKPETVLGHEFVGEVMEVGADVHNLHPGDRVGSQLYHVLWGMLVLPSWVYQQLPARRLGIGMPD